MATQSPNRLALLRSRLRAVDAARLKWVGILTYFLVYACIALGARRELNAAFASFPDRVRPAPIAPLDVALGLPTSVAWGCVSLGVAVSVVALLAAWAVGVGSSKSE
ncbi:hypothetical protein [Halegenticoccus tardaugens]|uniref:hypothetical protein n=1 Tax=Halegenticoccus tardaugens TaxID=2071624 RepID=UPI00100AAA18|nr:hypothetical protein [Halegenticoccus tardaugens]